MEKTIDRLIMNHENNSGKEKYILVCAIDEFKILQKLLSEKYNIKDYQGVNSIWRHVIEDDSNFREGTARFKNFDLNVYCSSKIVGGFVISKMNRLPMMYMDIFKNNK